MPNRSYTAGSQFRYGFNGKENDNDVKGTGNQQDYGMRIYDPRIGKFLSVDPLTADYPSWSPYPFAMNRPIDGIDLDGCEWQPVNATGENVAVGSKETSDYRWVGFGLDGKGAEGTVASAILRHGTSTYKFNSSFDQKTRRGTGSLAISDGKGNSLNIRIFGDNSAQWSQSSNGKITETAVYQDRFYKGTPGNISDKGTFVARDVTGYTGLDFSFKRTTNNVWCGWYPEAIESVGLGPVEFLIGAGEFRLAGRGLSALGRGLSYFGRNAAKGGTFYRAMSNAEFAALESSGGLSHMAGKELFVSNSLKYSRDMMLRHPDKYDVLVQFNMKPGAMNYFNQVGVMHRTAAGASGWAGRGNLLWKAEGPAMNLGIQSNTHMFNPWISSFKKIH